MKRDRFSGFPENPASAGFANQNFILIGEICERLRERIVATIKTLCYSPPESIIIVAESIGISHYRCPSVFHNFCKLDRSEKSSYGNSQEIRGT